MRGQLCCDQVLSRLSCLDCDQALKRPGRLGAEIYVGLPDETTRREIFRVSLRRMPLAGDVNINDLAQRTTGYSGAEVRNTFVSDSVDLI